MEIYIVSIVSTVLGYFSSILANRNPKGVLATIGVVSLLAGTTVGLLYAGHWIGTPVPASPPPVAQREKDKLEGQWVEEYTGGGRRTYVIVTIKYNSDAKYLEFYGDAYDATLNVAGHWKTVVGRLDGNRYDYVFEGVSNNPKKSGPRKGVGSIWFLENGNHGEGQFISVREDRKLRDFELHKILDGNAEKESRDNPKGFIQKLYTDPGYLKQLTTVH